MHHPHLCVDLVDDPLQSLASLARIQADLGRKHVLHIVAERDALHGHRGLLAQQCLGGIRGMRLVEHSLVDGDKVVERHVDRLQHHLLDGRVHRGRFTREADLCRADDLKGGWRDFSV